MANRALLGRKEQFEHELAVYRGDDPLNLWYEFLFWLDGNFGKENILDTFTSTLERALNAHWNEARYKDDSRLVELQMIYASIQPDPLKFYKSYYDRGIATLSAVLYINWANHLAAVGDYHGADKIFKLGCEKTSSNLKHDLSKAFEKFLATVGRRYLDGEIQGTTSCCKCRAPPAEEIVHIQMNPGQAGCWDDYVTVVAYFEDPDPKYVPMYPKDKVYKEAGKEWSLEEIKAAEFFSKERSKKPEEQKAEEGTRPTHSLVVTPKSFSANYDVPPGTEPETRGSVFPVPLLPKGKEESISAQSFTSRTKMAMNLIQEMWSSPSPVGEPARNEDGENRPSVTSRNEERENKTRTPFPIYVDENPETPKAAERKPLTPFAVFSDCVDNAEKANDGPVHLSTRGSTAKKNSSQPKMNVLSERKSKAAELIEQPKPRAKQHLFDADNDNEALTTKLSEASVSDPRTQFQPFGGIKPLFPADQGNNDDDTTCNTRAFNFALPSSTPLQQKKSLAPYHRIEQNQGNVPDEGPSYHTQQNLSVILEASKERCSSSGSCASQPRTPGIPSSKSFQALRNSVLTGIGSGAFINHHASPHTSGKKSLLSWIINRTKTKPGTDLTCNTTGPTRNCADTPYAILSDELVASRTRENPELDRSRTGSLVTPVDGSFSGSQTGLPSVKVSKNLFALLKKFSSSSKASYSLPEEDGHNSFLSNPVSSAVQGQNTEVFPSKLRRHRRSLRHPDLGNSKITTKVKSLGILQPGGVKECETSKNTRNRQNDRSASLRQTRQQRRQLGPQTNKENVSSTTTDSETNFVTPLAEKDHILKRSRSTVSSKKNHLKADSPLTTPLSEAHYRLRSSTIKIRVVNDVHKQLMLEDLSDIDPFCPTIIEKLLRLINFPLPHHVDGYHVQNLSTPSITKTMRLGNETLTTSGDLGRGAYARVVKASNDKSTVALKVEKPACKWEYYIAKEIQRRVDPNVRSAFMDIKAAHIYNNGSILITDWAKHGSLLNIVNLFKQKTGKTLEPLLATHFSIEVIKAVEYLHKAKIIHGDIKPDNFVIRALPSANETEPCLMLIDFGRSIDMSLFPDGTKFLKVVTTEGFQCNEMKEHKPWNYQTDLYGLAATIYCLLAGDYMKVVKKNGEWKLHKPLPRCVRREIWDPILHELINVPSCEKLPNLTELRKKIESSYNDYNRYDKIQNYTHLFNIVRGK